MYQGRNYVSSSEEIMYQGRNYVSSSFLLEEMMFRRRRNIRGCLRFVGHFPQKSPVLSFNIIHHKEEIMLIIRYKEEIMLIGRRNPRGCLRFVGHFPQKSPVLSGSFAEMTCNLRHPVGLCHPVRADVWIYLDICGRA